MSWESARDRLQNKTLGQVATEMKQAGLEPIVLRWNKALKTSQNVYGLYGAKCAVGETLDGRQEVNGKVDPNTVVTFFSDEYNFGYAVIPRCDRNMDVLAATYGEKDLPWTIDDKGVSEEVSKMAEKLKPAAKAPAKKGATLAELAA